MFRFKVGLGIVGIVGIVSALGASSAFATNGKYGGFTGTATISGSGGEEILESVIASQKVEIKCASDSGTGEINSATGADSATLEFATCKLFLINATTHVAEESTVCTVANPVAKISSQLEAGTTLVQLKASGTNFTEIKITGASCVAKGTFAVTGEVTCSGPEGTVALVTHVLNCNSAKSTLKLASEAARLTGSTSEKLTGTNAGKTYWGE
jgi:hypothetical protein